MDAKDFSTARKYLALMIAFDYQALESAAVNREFAALKAMLELPESQIADGWNQWKSERRAEARHQPVKNGGPPYHLPAGSIKVSLDTPPATAKSL